MKKGYLNLGLIGNPLGHTMSPVLHTEFLHQTGINGGFCCFEIPDEELVEETLEMLRSFHFRGLSVTVPYKDTVFGLCDRLDESALAVGAVNCLRFDSDGYTGFNTDLYGFEMNLKVGGVDPSHKDVLLIGAGGASKAVVVALSRFPGVRLTVANRTVEKAEELCRAAGVDAQVIPLSELDGISADVVINGTAVGLKGEEYTLSRGVACREAAVDLQYSRTGRTSFLSAFSGAGVNLVQGFPMLAYQAYRAFEIWSETSFPFDYTVIAKRIGVTG